MASDNLDRELITRAAIELLDADGLDGLSMRRLGSKLGAGATSIYWYVKNKDALFALAADEVFGAIDLPDPHTVGWRQAAASMAHGLRSAILEHTWLGPVFGTHPVYGPKMARWVDHCLGIFTLAGFSGSRLDWAGDTVLAYVLGKTLSESAVSTRKPAEMADLISRARQTAEAFPRLRERFDAPSEGDGFDFGLDVVLDGLEAALRPRTP
ncbi:TetR/AcrR family transcriptional regulator C-terminal domain-containing protein [Actinoplanes sp. ATCC 53533]|uniref:TetR/AcrR family transcriptional regulator C-terminal domain-containing protein n=1 Tax=Actinoplanes sp. ATCC 53533 TaxID=1288362 RepID=UPI001315A2B0|nr:TetR/AcrR family transcriptional regulator C-terminal domain-containing protein [Actinoplanes sp. ATCC 53533]